MLIPSHKAGYLGKTYGTEGYLKVHILEGMEEYLLKSEFVFVDHNGQFVPYKIVNKDQASHLVLQLANHESKESAQDLVGLDIYLDEWNLELEDLKGEETAAWVGWILLDHKGQEIGQITEIEEMPTQILATVLTHQENEVKIPLIEDWILDLDLEQQKLTIELPEGLLEINNN